MFLYIIRYLLEYVLSDVGLKLPVFFCVNENFFFFFTHADVTE